MERYFLLSEYARYRSLLEYYFSYPVYGVIYNAQDESNDIDSISLVEIHQYSTLSHMIKIGSANFIYTPTNLDINTASSRQNVF